MKALIQRVKTASVMVDHQMVGGIDQGLLLFLGVDKTDNDSDARRLADKVISYRVFSDEQGRMNLSLLDLEYQLLIVSQFTLSADTRKGTKPSFSSAAAPLVAEQLYNDFVSYCCRRVKQVETGVFGADMQVSLVNDGPVTFMLEV